MNVRPFLRMWVKNKDVVNRMNGKHMTSCVSSLPLFPGTV